MSCFSSCASCNGACTQTGRTESAALTPKRRSSTSAQCGATVRSHTCTHARTHSHPGQEVCCREGARRWHDYHDPQTLCATKTCAFVCVRVCVCVRACACVCVCARVITHTHTHTHTHTSSHPPFVSLRCISIQTNVLTFHKVRCVCA